MIFDFIMSAVSFVLDRLIEPLVGLMGLDTTNIVYWAEYTLGLVEDGWKFLNIFVPGLDICLGMAVFCVSVEMIYKGYLLVMWIIKKIPVLGVS